MAPQPSLAAEREARLEEIVLAYLQAGDAGGTLPDRRQLLERHPDLAPELEAFFADQSGLVPLLVPLRALTPGRPPAPAPPPAVGDYEVLGEVARGGMGVVYKARQVSAGRVVALKMMKAGPLADPDEVRRFRAEAGAAAHLDHPGIVPIYEVGEHEGQPFFSMRLVEGGSLAGHLPRLVGDHRAGARLLAQVARAVHHAHQRGILHRDLKPSNVLLDAEGRPQVTDFGLAKRIEGSGALTQTGAVMGTPEYMAPEQALARKGLSTAADVYGLGAILYELLTGRPPFRGDSTFETLRQVVEAEPSPPRALNRRVDRDLETVCLKCLQKEPAKRYGSAEALAEDLERWLAGEPVAARPAGRAELAVRWMRRHPALAGAAMLLVAAVVALSVGTAVVLRAQWQAEAARQRETEQRERADANLLQALDTVDRMLTRVGWERLARVPGMEHERQQLLQDALDLYQGFLRDNGAAPHLRREVGKAHWRTARIYQLLGKPAEAEQAYRDARSVQAPLLEEFPGEATYRQDLAVTYNGLGSLLHEQERNGEAQASYQQAVDTLEAAAEPSAASPAYQNDLAASYTLLGTLYNDTLRLADAETAFRKAVQFLEPLSQSHPEDSEYGRALATCYRGLAQSYANRMRRQEAERAYLDAMHKTEQLARDRPEDPECQNDLAKSCNELGFFYYYAGQRAAKPAYQKSLEIREKLRSDHPGIPDYQNDLALILKNLGIWYRMEQDWDRAESYLRRCREILEPLVHDHPEEPRYAVNLGATYMEIGRSAWMKDLDKGLPTALVWDGRSIDTLESVLKSEPRQRDARRFLDYARSAVAELQLRSGHPEEASKHYDRMIEVGEGQSDFDLRVKRAISLARRGRCAQAAEEARALQAAGEGAAFSLYDVACVYALCAAQALQDTKRSPAERERLNDHYAADAVKVLLELRAAGYFSVPGFVAEMKQDIDLESLRGRVDYKEFVRSVESGAKPSTGDPPQ